MFTHFLLKALADDPSAIQGDNVLVDEVFSYLSREVADFSAAKFGQTVAPVLEVSGERKIPLKKSTVVAIGVSKYDHPGVALQYGSSDARAFADAIDRRFSAKTTILVDSAARRDAVLAAVDDAARHSDDGQTLVIYFSGHGWNIDGQQYLAPADATFEGSGDSDQSILEKLSKGLWIQIPKHVPNSVIGMTEIQAKLNRSKARFKLLIFDTCANNPFQQLSGK